MIQSANQKQEMKSVPHPFQTCSKYFGSSNFGSGNKCCPANESMVCTNIILFLFEATVNPSYKKKELSSVGPGRIIIMFIKVNNLTHYLPIYLSVII